MPMRARIRHLSMHGNGYAGVVFEYDTSAALQARHLTFVGPISNRNRDERRLSEFTRSAHVARPTCPPRLRALCCAAMPRKRHGARPFQAAVTRQSGTAAW